MSARPDAPVVEADLARLARLAWLAREVREVRDEVARRVCLD